MAQEEFNPLDPYSELPAIAAPETDLGAYLPEPYEPKSRGHRGPVTHTVNKDLPPEARALLDVIASDEAPDYNTMYGGRKFENMSQHPGIYTDIKSGPNAGRKSSAAGRYQFLKSTWDNQAAKLGLNDFSPESQDLAAWDLASSTYARKTGRDLLGDLRSGDPRYAGRISSALSSIWTSLPGGIEQRSHANKFVNRYAESLAQHGGEVAPQGPQGETYDIPLSNGQILHAPVGVPREEAIANIRASGLDVEGLTPHKLTTGQTLHIPDSVNIADALANLQKQFPDQEWMTEEHAAKTGFLPAAGAAFKGVGAQFERGAGELLKSPELIAKGKAWQEELAKEVEAPLPTDPLSKKLAYYGGTALGGLAPLGAAVVAAPLLPEAAAMGALGAATVPIATGSLAQRYDEQGKPFDPYELQNIGAVGTEAVLQTLPFTKFAPVAGQVGKSLAKGAAGAAAADVPSVAIERAAAGQPLADEQALEEYAGTLAADVLAGGTLGAVGGMRGRGVRAPEVPPVQEGAAPRPIEPAPEGGEALAPTEGPVESVEDLEAQARAGEDFFRQAEAAGIPPETVAPEMVAPEAEIPEPTVRGREQAVPTVEEAALGEAPAEPVAEPHFAESILGLKPTKAKTSLYNKLQDLDINNVGDHPRIEELVAGSKILSGDKLDALSARMKEVEDAQQIPQAGAPDGRGGAQPGFREEGRDQAIGGEGVEPSGQRIETPEVKAPEEKVKFAKAEEPTHIDVDGVQRPVHDSTGQRIHTTDEGVKNFWKNLGETKVVDEEGKPIRVYHGTDKTFTEFKPSKTGTLGQGMYFALDKNAAKEWAATHKGAKIEEAYLSVKNPYKIDSTLTATEQLWDKFKATSDADLINKLRESGYDGIWAVGSGETKWGTTKPEIVVFDPEQIKSAINNIGTFDTTKPDIREARGVAPEAAHSVESLNDHIVKTYGKNAPQVEVLTREQAGVEPNVKGFYDPNTKKVALIADNIGKDEDIHGLMRHEVAVHAKRLGKTDPEFQSILDRLKKLKEQGDTTVAKAYDRVPRDTTPENIHEEALAYLTQHAPQLPVVKQFTSWLRRTAHKLTGSSDWLKADDFAPMADAILKKGEPTAAPKERMYSIGDTADEAVRNTNTETWFERFYTPIRTQYASVRAPLEAILGKLPLYDENNEIRATAKIAQQTRYAHLVSEALHNGYLKRNAQGLVEAVFDPRLSPDRLIKRVMELPEDLRDRFSESMVTLAQAGHNLRGAEMKAVMDEAQRKIKLGQAYLDQTRTRYEKAEGKLEEAKSASARAKETAAEYSRNVLATAERNASTATAEVQKIAAKVNRGLDVDAEVIDAALKRQEKAQADLATAKSFAEKLKQTATTDLEKAQREFDAAKAEYRNPNYTAGKDYIALQQRLYKAVKDQYGKAQRDEAGRIYDISPAQERAAREFLESTPETKQLASDIRELLTNNAKLLRDTSVISNATYKKFTEAKYNYAPLYMSIEDLDAAMPASAVYLQGGQRKVMPVKGLKGGQHQVRFFENLLTHQARTGAMALHNNARLSTLESLAEIGRAKELPGTTPPPKNLDVVAAIKDGKRRYYHVPDRPLYEAFEMVHNLPVPDWITDTTKFASRAMLVNPKYWWNQLIREPFMATFTSRAGVITPFHTGKEFASLLFSELPNVDTSAAQLYRELKAQGVSGSHEYLRDLIKEKGKLEASKGLAKNYKDSKDLVMRIHEYADAATKVAVMRKALERAESGELTGTPLQGDAARDAAITHVGEMINFANRGRNATVQYITQATPFFNSWAQGMDAIIRHATGYGMDPHAKGKTIAGLRTTFISHAAAMMAFSAAITALRCELSEDYRNADPDEWSANWLIPIPDSFETKKGRLVKAKGPFELNTLFKLGPEMWVRNWYGLDRDKDYTATLKSSIWRDIAPPGLDHLFMPYLPMLLLESVTGYRASEGEIKPLADTSLAPAERGKGVSPIADVVSAGVLSPASVKHLGQGMFGGMYDMLDSTAKGAAAAFGSDTARADLRDLTEKVPVISGMLTNPDRIELSSAYEFADKQAMARHTAKVLSKRGDKEAAAEYKEEGRYAKQAERIKRKISKTNTAIERLKNTKEYEDADKIQRDYEAMLERKRKQVEKLEALRTKSKEKD